MNTTTIVNKASERKYREGAIFLYDSDIVMLCQISANQYKLIALDSGNRMSDRMLTRDQLDNNSVGVFEGFTLKRITSSWAGRLEPITTSITITPNT